MMTANDLDLLQQYARQKSEEAFATLVRRHVDLVYSAAWRQVRSAQFAEEVVQSVFTDLARSAHTLKPDTILTAWLYQVTRRTAIDVVRRETRRQVREQIASEMNATNATHDDWTQIEPLIDDAMATLDDSDRAAVLLRYFENKSLHAVGQQLGVSDDAAQKRVSRAIERLREFFARSGVVVPATILAPALINHAVQAAPVTFASGLAASVASAGSTGLGVGTFNLLKGMTVVKLKAHAVGVLVAAILLFSGAIVFFKLAQPPVSTKSTNQLSNPAFVLRGTVHTPDGKPLAGALVRVATQQTYVRLYQTVNAVPSTNDTVARTNITGTASNQLARAPMQAPSTNTAADGSFVIGLPELPKDGLAAVVVNSDAGYALVTADELSANPDVRVQPWARLEGVLHVGKSLASNETVNIGIWGSGELYDWNLVQHAASTKTDANGRFVFPRVAPVDVWLTHSVMVKSNDWRQSGHHYVKVLPGDQMVVQLGGKGRTLTGEVSLDPTSKLVFYGTMWANQKHSMRWPRNVAQMTIDEKRQYERAWRDSSEGELFKNEVRNYEFPVQPDGTFRVNDVLPGSYRLNVRADERRPDGKGMRNAAVAEIPVYVSELLADESDEPIDLGTLTPWPVSNR